MKFIHTADWQIGMTFHGFKEKSRSAMEDDRIEVIEAIGDFANNTANGIDFVSDLQRWADDAAEPY